MTHSDFLTGLVRLFGSVKDLNTGINGFKDCLNDLPQASSLINRLGTMEVYILRIEAERRFLLDELEKETQPKTPDDLSEINCQNRRDQ